MTKKVIVFPGLFHIPCKDPISWEGYRMIKILPSFKKNKKLVKEDYDPKDYAGWPRWGSANPVTDLLKGQPKVKVPIPDKPEKVAKQT